jgi:tetratricopeptide (TPR) repeat protein
VAPVTAHLKYSRIPRIVPADEFRHRAFLQALANGNVASNQWLAARAGLLALRYVDAWATGEWLPVQLMAERAAVTDAIAAIPAGDQMRGLLAVVLDRATTEWAVTGSGDPYALAPSAARIAAPLLAYAHALQFSSQWALAADVYLIVWDACGPHSPLASRALEDSESATTAALRLGACYRILGDSERANAAYESALAIANLAADKRSSLWARLGKAKLIQDRGNLPRAEECIADVIRDATTAQLQDIRAWAFHDRSLVAYQREQYPAAVEWGFEAWAIERDPSERQRILCDLAVALLGAGYVELARTAHRLLAASGREPAARWFATVNLIEIAVLERDREEFERLARSLRTVALPPVLLANYHYYVVQGELEFGRHDRARTEFARALKIAEQHSLGEIIIKAEAAILGAQSDRTAVQSLRSVPVPPEFAHITDALHGACAAAVVGAE